MPEVIFPGPAGRIEGFYQPAKDKNAPLALLLHSHPRFGGSMNNPLILELAKIFSKRKMSVLRFNYRGVGRSQGEFDQGAGELSDAATALDWMQLQNPDAGPCWVAGISFGAWIGMQLLMRRPEIIGFVTVAPPANVYDFSFLAPCPSSGVVVHGEADQVAPLADVYRMVERTRTQKGRKIEIATVPGANHFFEGKLDEFSATVEKYVDRRLIEDKQPETAE
ncbi:MAG: alpha/beta hydrolase [Parvularculaceae bacterium]